MNNPRIIRVTGRGQIKAKPDMTRITITMERTRKDYGEVLHRSGQDTEYLKDILSVYGFARSDLKTLSFNVDTKYESYKEEGVYRQRLVGYTYRHILKIEFDSDNERLEKILYALANCPMKPEFRISYTVKDPEAARNELLGNAVTDAGKKAAVLAAAAGVALEEIQSIDYSWGEINLEVHPIGHIFMEDARLMAAPDDSSSYHLDIEPDDITVSETVTVIWGIS